MRKHGKYIEFNGIVSMGIEEGHVPFQIIAKLIVPHMVQALRKGKACNGKATNN
jgi:hypothetical protein